MTDDAELLSRYAAEQSEAAFAELTRRHVDLVHSAVLRLMNGDLHAAQDVTQQVFTEVARQAKRLARHPALVGPDRSRDRERFPRADRTLSPLRRTPGRIWRIAARESPGGRGREGTYAQSGVLPQPPDFKKSSHSPSSSGTSIANTLPPSGERQRITMSRAVAASAATTGPSWW